VAEDRSGYRPLHDAIVAAIGRATQQHNNLQTLKYTIAGTCRGYLMNATLLQLRYKLLQYIFTNINMMFFVFTLNLLFCTRATAEYFRCMDLL